MILTMLLKMKFKTKSYDFVIPKEFLENCNIFLTKAHKNYNRYKSDNRFNKHLGIDAISAFYLKETLRINVSTRHPNLLSHLISAKEYFNFYLLSLAEDLVESLKSQEDIDNICSVYPPWVKKFVLSASDNLFENRYAY